MNRGRVILLVFFIMMIIASCNNSLRIEPDYANRFVKFFGTDGNQFGKGLVVLPDGFLILGESSTPNGNKLYLVKSDPLGNEVWSTSYAVNDSYSYTAGSISLTRSGNYIISSTVDKGIDTDVMLMRVDASGIKIDSAVYGLPNYDDVAGEVIETSNNSFIVVGTSFDTSPNALKYGITAWRTLPSSLDTLPQTQWARNYSKGIKSSGASVLEYNSSYYFLGTSNAANNSQLLLNNLTIYPVNETGGNFQNKFYGTDNDDFALKMIKTSGGFALLGRSDNGGLSNIFIQQISNTFIHQNKILVAGTREVVPLSFAASNSDFVVIGTENLTVDDTNIYLTKINSGGVLWEKTFGGVEIDSGGGGIAVLADGSIVFVGTVELNNQYKIALIKTDADGNLNRQ